jgi:hypothetical protein
VSCGICSARKVCGKSGRYGQDTEAFCPGKAELWRFVTPEDFKSTWCARSF